MRRGRIFLGLARRTGAALIEDSWYPVRLRRVARGRLGILPTSLIYRLPQWGPRPKLAASERLRDRLLDAARVVTDPVVVAIYDDVEAQARALGVTLEPDWLAEVHRRQARNVATFRWLVVPTASFAELVGLDGTKVIVGGNGTDTARIVPGPWAPEPTIGIVSGAAPGRGFELLIAATRLARTQLPELRLRMWLVPTDEGGARYLAGLRASVAAEPWVEISTAPYERLGETLAQAWALCIPHPANDYMDVALPVKLFDSFAAGRPVIVTPRRETAAIVESREVGVVTRGDSPEDVAAAIVELVGDEQRTRRLGARAREVAEREFDWRIVGDAIAAKVLAREGERS